MTTQQAMNVAAAPLDHSKQEMSDALIVLRDALRAAESQVERLLPSERQSGSAEAMREAAAKAVRQAFTEAADSRTPMPSLLTFANVVAARIERLPVPPARTSEPAARTYEDGVRDAAKAVNNTSAMPLNSSTDPAFDVAIQMREWCREAVESLLPAAPTPGRVFLAQCAAKSETGIRCIEDAGHRMPHEASDGRGELIHWTAAPTPGPTPAKPFDPDDAHRFPFAPAPLTPFVPTTPGEPMPWFDAEAAFKAQAAQLIHAIGSGRQYVTCDDLLLSIEAARAAGRRGTR